MVDNKFRLPDLHNHSLLEVHVLLLLELFELVDLLEDGASFHEARIPHNDQHQKLVVSDKSMVAASSKKELGAKSPQNEDAVEYQELRQKMFQEVVMHFQMSKLVVDTCQRIAARVASSCNGPKLDETADGYIDRIAGVDSANLQDCCMRSNAEVRTRTDPLSG